MDRAGSNQQESKEELAPEVDEGLESTSDRYARLSREVNEQKEAVARAEALVGAKRNRLSVNRETLARARSEAIDLEAARDSLGTWLHERSRSLAVRLLDTLDHQENQLEREERVVKHWTESQLPIAEGRARRLRSAFVLTLWLAFGLATLIPLGLWLFGDWLRSEGRQMPLLEDDVWKYLVVGVVIFALMVLIGLIRYFRGYIAMKIEMEQMLARGKFLLNAIDQLRSERARIHGLLPQVKERLEFLGTILHQPWIVPGLGGGSNSRSYLSEHLPANLQIASTADSNDPAIRRLRSRFIAEQLKPGIRRSAVAELLQAAGGYSGMSSDQTDLRIIDKDVAAYGIRNALLSSIQRPEVLESVGRTQVARIASDIQAGLGPASERPGIELTNADALQGLELGHDLLREWADSETHWDDYVVEILEDGAAMSRLAFSGLGLAASRHTRFTSMAVAPERLHDKAGQLVEFATMESDGVAGTEVSIRLDITEPIEAEHVALFAETIEAGHSIPASQSNEHDSSSDDDNLTLA